MQDLRALFESEYPGKERLFGSLIKPIFSKAKDTSLTDEQVLADSDRRQIKSFSIIAQVRGGFPIVFADVELQDTVDLKRSRVAIQNCVRKVMQDYSNAIIFFHFTDNAKEWRVSYVYRAGTNKSSTSAKRYTYLCGPEHVCRTVSERFETLKGLPLIKNEDLIKAFSVEALTKEFYNSLFGWYKWACENVTFPAGDTSTDSKGKHNVRQTKDSNELNLIRLITRLMFVWFIKQKDLIPSWVFDQNELGKILADFDPESEKDGNYYNAVLQNLFFATLNKKIEERAFADDKKVSYNKQFGVKNFYRDNAKKSFFKESNQKIIERFRPVPFLNGGLFECLDKLDDDKDGMKNIQEFTDGFSREPEWMAFVPNMLFWQEDDGKHEGLIHLLNRYNFTVDENSPSDVQVALDPELLGKVFENLLGTYNPETSETARKSSGSFYTPRQIVSFMVDEAIKAYLSKAVKSISAEELNTLFDDGTDVFGAANKEEIVSALKKLKIFDPACGSGAFPMGALQRIVHLIQKCGGVEDDRASLYALKLSLIENCLYGADIQPIAVQICKLRFFISLICEQERTDSVQDNYGVNPLPNLETKFVAANSLIGLERNAETELFSDPDGKIAEKKAEIQGKRHEHFNAPTAELKAKCRREDKKLREELVLLLEKNKTFAPKDANQLAGWNPYDQNAVSGFFDAEWMFNVSDGFDIVIGNPPYVQLQKAEGRLANLYETQGFETFTKTGDIYCLFYENGSKLLNKTGVLCFITSNKWMRAGYGEKLRGYFAKNVDPKLLVDFAGVKVFESATVDTNILLLKRGKNEGKTVSCTATALTENGLANLGDFVRQNSCQTKFTSSESWVILSPIEQSIKAKIEKAGTPLKDWNINIYRGVLTGFNDAFIISEEKRQEILNSCKSKDERERTAELIRPILRGRDIKRYNYEYADLYLIATFPSKHYDIEKYPAIKNHLLSFGKERLEQTGKKYKIKGDEIKARKKTNNKWFETQDSISYWDEFNKPKIVWGNLNLSATYTLAPAGMMINAPATMIVPANHNLLCVLNSKLADYYIRNLGVTRNGGYFEYKPMFIEQLPVPQNIAENAFGKYEGKELKNEKEISRKVYELYGLTDEEMDFIEQQR